MKIEEIIYQTTRGMHGVEDRMKIASIFLFCNQLGSVKFSELLYCKNKEGFINDLQKEYEEFNIDLSINFGNTDVSRAFNLTIEEVIKREDSNGFYQAIFEKDPFALVIIDIVGTDFDYKKTTKMIRKINGQLTLF